MKSLNQLIEELWGISGDVKPYSKDLSVRISDIAGDLYEFADRLREALRIEEEQS